MTAWLEAKAKGVPLAAFCRDYGMSRGKFYDWLRAEGRTGEPRRTKKITPILREKVLEIHRRYFGTWSAETISLALGGRISAWSVRRILRSRSRGGVSHEREVRARSSWPLAANDRPDAVWAVDWTEFRVAGEKAFILMLLDQGSRYWLGWEILSHAPAAQEATSFMRRALDRYAGRPLLLKSDRAQVFMSGAWEDLLASNGILPYRVRPHCPQDQGAVERAIRDVKRWLRARRPRDRQELGAALDEGVLMLNFLKPRAVLAGRTPAAVYFRGKGTGGTWRGQALDSRAVRRFS